MLEENFKINPISSPEPEIGIDTDKTLFGNIIGAAQVGALDLSSIEALTQSAQTREQTYEMIDTMAQDSTISAVLETYAEDTVQMNDKGQTIWIEADDLKILNYTSWLIDSLNIDKHLYAWAYCLVTYGDVYLRLYRQSDIEEDKLFSNNKNNRRLNESESKITSSKEALNEQAQLIMYSNSDKYIPYVEMVANPGEMFDLQKFGKTHGYIKAPVQIMNPITDETYSYITKYKAKQSDVEIYDATTFVHGCLENTNQRQPETIDIYLDNYINEIKNIKLNDYNFDEFDYKNNDSMISSYNIRRGQSLLYNCFKTWQELNLLELSALLNRLTKSSIVRILNIDVGDMPKEQVQIYLQRLKEKIEQKAAVAAGKGMSEYTNPGPIENTIYVPTHEGKGAITTTTIGGDFDPKSLIDLEYFRDQLFGALKVPKQFFGITEDGAGFNGGTSLTILSARYGKTIKNIQNILCQMVSDLINLFLIDRGLDNYVNKFKVRMQEPITQEEIDRRSNTDNRIRYVGDVMQQLTDIEDPIVKLKIYKSLITGAVNDSDVMKYLQEYIEKLEIEQQSKLIAETNIDNNESTSEADENDTEENTDSETLPSFENLIATSEEKEVINEEEKEEEEKLPSPEDLDINMLDD